MKNFVTMALATVLLAACGESSTPTATAPAEKAEVKVTPEMLDADNTPMPSCDLEAIRVKTEGVQTLSWTEHMQLCEQLRGAIGLPAVPVLRAAGKAVSLMSIQYDLPEKDSGYQLANIIEARQQTEPTAQKGTIDTVFKIVGGSQGHVTPRDINVFLRASGDMAHTLSDDGLMNMAAMIWQEKKARGE